MTDFIVKYWLQVAFGGVVYFFIRQYKKICGDLKAASNRNDALKLGVQALLRDRIIQVYNHYQAQGYMPIYARENMAALYKEYHNLGGNSTVDHLVESAYELPYEKPKGE